MHDPGQFWQLEIPTDAQMQALGLALLKACDGPTVIYLRGDLGAGKTTLVRGGIRGLGYEGAVKSPTYTLMEPYQVADRHLFHLDLYRLADPEEVEYLGLRDHLAEDAVVLIEWPDKGAGWLPAADLEVAIEHRAQGRGLTVRAETSVGVAALARLQAAVSINS